MCTKTKARVLLVTFNFLFWVAGSVMLGFGIWMKVDPKAIINYMPLIKGDYTDPLVSPASIIFIVIGALAFFVGFLGLCGAYNEKKRMLVVYCVMLVIFMIAEVSSLIIIIIYRLKVDDELKEKQWKEAFSHKWLAGDATESTWNKIQSMLECCGITGYADYQQINATWWFMAKTQINRSSSSSSSYEVLVPDTCCVQNSGAEYKTCQLDAKEQVKTSKHLHTKGCLSALEDWIKSHTAAMVAIAVGIVAFELFGSITSCYLIMMLNRSSSKD